MAEIKLTPAQRQAVEDRGGALLVSASAGSGKTKVLVERLFSYLEREGCRVDDFLIITYTRAAAAELRSKIAAELSRRVAERPDDAHLRRQLFRVYQADIKTVDAFCAALLRENVHLLPPVEGRCLTPDFRVLDQQEAELLRLKVLQQTLEDFYQRLEAGDDRCELLAETLGAGRDDRKLEQLVLELHAKLQSHARPIPWLHRVAAAWADLPDRLEDTAHGRVILADTERRAAFWAGRLRREAEDLRAVPVLYGCYAPGFCAAADGLDRLAAAAGGGDWAAVAAAEPAFPTLKASRDPSAAVRREAAKAVWDRCKKEIRQEMSVYRTDAASWLSDLRMMAPAMLALTDLTERFALAYQAEKVRRNLLDFSDQEHYAVELLVDGEGEPTELARRVGQRYREVMVDEFQDTNEVQNWIFRAISDGERRLFAVGDVKQSIYRFRLADPTIFLDKYRSYRNAGGVPEGEPRRILLQSNFRSRRRILDAANFVFAGVMSRQTGEMDYGADEELRFGADYQPREDDEVEFHLISVEDTEEESFERDAVEAGFIARRVRQLLDEGYPVRDGDAVRPVRPEDIVVLMRSPRARLGAVAAAMARENVPFAAEEDEDFFSAMEVAVMISFLQIVDNPRQDVPLIAVLRSPLFGFTADDLARIRGRQSAGDFYGALCRDDAPESAAFLARLDRLRLAARDLPVDRLLWQIYTDCHAMAVFGAMEGGEQRKSNLIALFTYAGTLSAAGKGGLFDFITYLKGLLDREKAPAVSTRRGSGGVRLMSVHKSKGLEFPVVILADLQREFNAEDLRRSVLVHPDLGLGPECVDRERRIRYDTVSKLALARQLRLESLAEEMRILYVAMTRAREKLILVDCMKRCRTRIRSLASLSSYPADPEAVRSARCPGDWILLPLLSAVEAGAIRAWAEVELPGSVPLSGWQIRVWENPVGEKAAADGGRQTARQEAPFDPALLERRYAHERAALIPTKVTATQLKGRELDEEIAEGAPVQRRAPGFAAPRFLRGERKLTAAERGTATHLVMQYLDFAASGEAAVAEQVRSLAERRLLTEEQAEAVDCAAVAAFQASPLARRIAGSERVWREYRFALLMPAALYDPAGADEELLLQGVADCVFDTPAGLVIVDFKTDRIRPGEEADRARTYRPQLEAYAAALSRVLERPVAERILYFFATGREIAL